MSVLRFLSRPAVSPKILARTAIAAVVILGTASAASAATYYVSPSGDNGNPGTLALPWRTIQKAATTMVAGDIAQIRGGVYSERVVITRSGLSSARITYKAYASEKPIIDGTGVTVPDFDALLQVDGADYVTIDGLEIRDSSRTGVGIFHDATYLELLNLVVHDNNTAAGGEAGILFGQCTVPARTRLAGSRVYNQFRGGIALWDCRGGYFLIENNTVFNNLGTNNWDGIEIFDTPYVVIRGNQVYDNHEDFIDIGGQAAGGAYIHHVVIEDNILWRSSASIAKGVTGIKVGNEARQVIVRRNRLTNLDIAFQSYEQTFNRVALYHNTVDGSSFGTHNLMLWSGENSNSWGTYHVKNNIFAFAKSFMIGLWENTIDATGLRLDGNLYRFGAGDTFEWHASGISKPYYGTSSSEFNRWRSNAGQEPSGGKYSTQSLGQLFVNAANRNYELAVGSDAIDSSVALTRTASAASGKQVAVAEHWYFFDGHGWLAPDLIKVGIRPPLAIESINETTGQILVASSISWSAGEAVNLPYFGSAPDAGALELSIGSPPSPPKSLRIVP